MPDQLKQALLQAGVTPQHNNDVMSYIDYLFRRCSVGRKRITDYLEYSTSLGTPVVYTDLYVVCKQYEQATDPERSCAKALRVAVSDVRRIRRVWGIRKVRPETVTLVESFAIGT